MSRLKSTWGILHRFEKLLGGESIKFTEVPLVIPPGIDPIIWANWNRQLRDKQQEMAIKGEHLEIRPYDQNSKLNALYNHNGEIKMWPGSVVTLIGVEENTGKVVIKVAKASYPYIAAINSPEVDELYSYNLLPKPRPALAVCTFALTSDNNLTMTVRGERTNVYPSRKYGQGGNPQNPKDDIVKHQMHEMEEEISVEPSDYDPSGFRFAAVVEDKEEFPGKTDLVGWVPVNLSSEEIARRVKTREKHPNDAVAVAFVPMTPDGLMKHLIETDPKTYCPPAYAGLVVYGFFANGVEWMRDLIKKL